MMCSILLAKTNQSESYNFFTYKIPYPKVAGSLWLPVLLEVP